MFFKKKNQTKDNTLTLKIAGMHCASCAMNIDGALEEIEDVISSSTNYAKAQSLVVIKPGTQPHKNIQAVIGRLGYSVETVSE